jgi:integrin alpha FG-GAP repeat containing protein 1
MKPPLPVSLKVGDANLDGYPDILFIAVDGSNRVPKLAFSTSCASHNGKDIVPGCAANGHGKRGYEVVTKDVEVLEKIKDARSLSFVDMDEDVRVSLYQKFSVVVYMKWDPAKYCNPVGS